MTPTPEGLLARLREVAAEIATDLYVFPDAVAELMTEAAAALAAMQQPAALDTGNLISDPLYKALDALYERGWTDLHLKRRCDPRGTVEWGVVLNLFHDHAAQLAAKDREIAELGRELGECYAIGKAEHERADAAMGLLADALPILREYAEQNPIWWPEFGANVPQDPMGAHALIVKIEELTRG